MIGKDYYYCAMKIESLVFTMCTKGEPAGGGGGGVGVREPRVTLVMMLACRSSQ